MKAKDEKREAKKYRAHGFGSLEKRGKMYVARWMVNGKRFTRSTGEHEIGKAREKLEEFTRPYRIGNEIEALQAHEVKIKGREAELNALIEGKAALKVGQIFSVFKKMPECDGLSKRHIERYERVLSGLADWLEKNRPEMIEARKVSRMAARSYADYLSANFAVSTRNIYVRLLRYIWKSIMRKENLENEDGKNSALRILEDKEPRARIEINPWDDVENVSLVGKEHSRRELTIDELKRICAYVTGELRLLFAIGIYTGLRLGDCVLMDWGEIDLARRRITVIPRKTRRKSGMEVVIPIHNVLYGMLCETPEKLRRGRVLPSCAKEYIDEESRISKRIKDVFESCGIKTSWKCADGKKARCDVGFHSLRHTFVSMAANAGASLELVRKIVGHTSRTMTRHYFHEDEAALRDTVAQLPDVTGGAVAFASAGPGVVETVEVESCGSDRSTTGDVAQMCADVQRFAGADRVAVALAAFDGMGLKELERVRAAIDGELSRHSEIVNV